MKVIDLVTVEVHDLGDGLPAAAQPAGAPVVKPWKGWAAAMADMQLTTNLLLLANPGTWLVLRKDRDRLQH